MLEQLDVALWTAELDVRLGSHAVQTGLLHEATFLLRHDDRADVGVGRQGNAAAQLGDLGIDRLHPTLPRDRDAMVAVDDEESPVELVDDDRREVALRVRPLDAPPSLLDLRALREEVAVEVADAAHGADDVGDADRANTDVGLLERAESLGDLVERQQRVRASPSRELGETTVGLATTRLVLLLNLFIVGWLQPWTHYGYERLRFDLRSGALGASMKVGEFNRLGKRMTLRIDRSEDRGTRLHGIFVQVDDRSGTQVAATAEQGRFLSTDDPDVILFRLQKGRLIQDSPKFQTPRTLSFDLYDLPINLPRVDSFRSRGHEELEELTLPELFRDGYMRNVSQEQRIGAQANLHFRIVEVLMMLMLPLLAVALAVPPKRSSSALGIFVGIVIIVAYHKVNQYAEQAAARGAMEPILAMWVPLLALSALIYWMYHVLAHRPGGQPIGALERAASQVAKSFRRLLPKVRPA